MGKHKVSGLSLYILMLILLLVIFNILNIIWDSTPDLIIEQRKKSLEIQKEIKRLDKQYLQLRSEYEKLKKRIDSYAIKRVRITFYHPPSGGINSDSDPNHTATMTRPIPGKTVAISSKLVKLGWLGKKIYIENWGVFYATDRMGPSIEGYAIDICAPTKKLAIDLGVIENVLATILLED